MCNRGVTQSTVEFRDNVPVMGADVETVSYPAAVQLDATALVEVMYKVLSGTLSRKDKANQSWT